ncbi:N-acetylmuramoyl-L-alanine amidase [Rhodococcus triatomae]
MTKTFLTAGFAAIAMTVALTPVAGAQPATAADPAPVAEGAAATTPLAGRTVFLDPGHQGTAHDEDLSRQVDDGRGGTKDCQTTGMTTLGGVPEHTITWDVAQLVKAGLEKLGAAVELSRQDDSGWGGCVDERARAANASGADLAVSIHADSTAAAQGPTARGFHLIVPTLPVPDATVEEVQSGAGKAATVAIRDAYREAGFVPANYAGVVDGIQSRSDLAGPALTAVPLAFVEMGNGSNPDDAAVLESQDGRLKHAVAIIVGAVDYLMGEAAAAPSPDPSGATTAGAATAPDQAPSDASVTGDSSPAQNPEEAASPSVVGQGLELLRTLLSALDLDIVQELANEQDLGVFAELLDTLLDLLA